MTVGIYMSGCMIDFIKILNIAVLNKSILVGLSIGL
jgi:hypothetical protein